MEDNAKSFMIYNKSIQKYSYLIQDSTSKVCEFYIFSLPFGKNIADAIVNNFLIDWQRMLNSKMELLRYDKNIIINKFEVLNGIYYCKNVDRSKYNVKQIDNYNDFLLELQTIKRESSVITTKMLLQYYAKAISFEICGNILNSDLNNVGTIQNILLFIIQNKDMESDELINTILSMENNENQQSFNVSTIKNKNEQLMVDLGDMFKNDIDCLLMYKMISSLNG
jgi:hypothetical protein